ncbi:CHAT domain-containing protein, partial [bacterium]|nr:CHAT domain-containing protein [bacterium]
MLTLHLTLTNNQVSVRANGKESHQFPLLDLSQSKEEWKDFFDNPRVYGEKLFNALFKDAARTEFDALSKQSERTIVLVLESSELDGVAWEYAYNKVKEEYVVEDCAFVRALPESERPANGRLKASYERVPLLFIPANPLVDLSGEPMPALDVDGEWKVITRHILTSAAPFDLCQLRPATPEDLQTILANFRNGLIVHFSGHGAATKDGAILLFEEKNGAARKYAASEFVRAVKDQAMIVFLSASQSAVAGKTEFSNLARELVEAGVPFALGMQFNLPDKYDDIISQQFYNYLARGYTIPEATLQARRALKNEAGKTGGEFFVGMIALYAAHPEETGKLAWHGSGAQIVPTFRPADVSDLPSPASGLIGRQRELMRIGTQLLEGKKPLTVTLHGAGGIGKTALLWQALLRFAP